MLTEPEETNLVQYLATASKLYYKTHSKKFTYLSWHISSPSK